MIVLLILLNIGHFLGDYTHLSTGKMLKAKGKPIGPIALHGLVHGLLCFSICLLYATILIKLNMPYPSFSIVLFCFIIMFLTHTAIDILKGRLNLFYPKLSNPKNVFHWYVFGLDQLLHQIVIILIAYIIVQYAN